MSPLNDEFENRWCLSSECRELRRKFFEPFFSPDSFHLTLGPESPSLFFPPPPEVLLEGSYEQ